MAHMSDDHSLNAMYNKIQEFIRAFRRSQVNKPFFDSEQQDQLIFACESLMISQFALEKRYAKYEQYPTKENKLLTIEALVEASATFNKNCLSLSSLCLKSLSKDYSFILNQCLISLLTSIVQTKQVCYSEQLSKSSVKTRELELFVLEMDLKLSDPEIDLKAKINYYLQTRQLQFNNINRHLEYIHKQIASLDRRSSRLNHEDNSRELRNIASIRTRLLAQLDSFTAQLSQLQKELDYFNSQPISSIIASYHSFKQEIQNAAADEATLSYTLNFLSTQLIIKVGSLQSLNSNRHLSQELKEIEIKEIQKEIVEISTQLDDLKRQVNDYAKKMLVILKTQQDLKLFLQVISY